MKDFDEWMQHGITAGWCGPTICQTHDGTPLSDNEYQQFDDGHDPCIHIIRLYPDNKTRTEVERDHSPSQWRKTTQ